jgi:hypothetical protein
LSSRMATVVIVLLGCSGAHAEEVRPWMFSAEGGLAAIHRTSLEGPFIGIRLHRVLWDDRLRLDAAGLAAAADEGFGVLEVGLEFRSCRAPCGTTAYLGAGTGRISEPEFGGWASRLDGGLEVRLSERNVLRFGVQGGTHGGSAGPHHISVAFGRRFGGRR